MREKFRVIYTDNGFDDNEIEKRIIEAANADLVISQCWTAEDVLTISCDADALLVQWAPITAEVIQRLERCKVIVRLGIGFDNVDLEAARSKGIPVCNVPDYCVDEVADHTLALAMSLARQLQITDSRLRKGTWKLTPPNEMPAFKEMTFATVGFGRIARAVHQRAAGFSFKLATNDKYVSKQEMREHGVRYLGLDQLMREADIISLHCPLTSETRHLINATQLQKMKASAILINTARGPLIDTHALARALNSGEIAGAGLDVFEEEPLPENHPIRDCENALLTSHTAWYSESSLSELQKKAAEELVRGLRGVQLENQVN